MSDDARSAYTKHTRGPRKGRRVLVVSNASPDASSGEEIMPPHPEHQAKPPRPRPLPNPVSSSPGAHHPIRFPNGPDNSRIPPPLSTERLRSSPSNPALSSPSSSSSPGAVESTPPPSTPGLSAHPLSTMPEEGTVRPGQMSIPMERSNDSTPPASRPPLSARVRTFDSGRRGSLSGSRPATVRCQCSWFSIASTDPLS